MKLKNIILSLVVLLPLFTSCTSDLDVKPLDKNINTPDHVYSIKENYKRALYKIYSVLAMSGQEGSGSSDIDGLDPGNAQFYRSWWNLQVASTDECINSWPDAWVPEITEMKWSAVGNESIEGTYQRGMFVVALVNEYLLQTTDGNMSSRGIEEDFFETVHGYRAEARFMRALSYAMLLDTYGNPPFITEENYTQYPSQIGRENLFDWIVQELVDLKELLPEEKAAGYYGRADRGVVNALLSRLYLNAEVYTGKPKYDECIAVSKEVINSGKYGLTDNYSHLFMADNDRPEVTKEIIFPIVFEGTRTQTYGGIHFLIAASRGNDEVKVEIDGLEEGWSGNRALPTLIHLFDFADNDEPKADEIKDKRGIFYDANRSIDIQTSYMKTFETEGWAVYKYTNIKSDGTPGSNTKHPDTDIPFLRLPEVYLNYAEAVLRGGNGGSKGEAVKLINHLRQRGYGDQSGNIKEADLTLRFLLDERSRELYWEGTRRSDLVRYGYYTSATYVWQYKGGVKQGTGIEDFFNLFPIPSTDLSVNGELDQNSGY